MEKNNSILLVCDDHTVSGGYLEALATSFRDIEFVASGGEALQAVEQRPFDLVLVDLRVRVAALLRSIKQKSPDTEVVIMTDQPNLADAKEAVRLGAYDYVGKPVAPEKINSLSIAALTRKSWALQGATAMTASTMGNLATAGRVLVVGEDAAAAQNLEIPFVAKGYVVERAIDGENALWKLSNDIYDAVFTDLDLRGISGLELAEEVYDAKPGLPVFILSESYTAPIPNGASAAGNVEFIRKPLTAGQIDDAVAQVLKLAPLRPTPPPRVEPSIVAKAYFARLRDIVLFVTAPFLGLFYILAFPVIGLGMFAWMGVKAFQRRRAARIGAPVAPLRLKAASARPGIARTVAMMIAAVVLGLVYGIVGPILGIGVVIWFAFDAWGKLGAKAIKVGDL